MPLKPCLRLLVPGLCLSLCACSHFTPPPLWQTLKGETSVALLSETGRELVPDNTLHPPVVAGTPVPETAVSKARDMVASVPAGITSRPVTLPESITPDPRLSQCRDELRALQGLDMSVWQRNRAILDEVLSGASRYVVLRPRLSTDMRQVMDSVHQAHLARACQKIHADLFGALLKRADTPTP
ncbi:hypothetical protein BRO79_23915 [Salmonella enterica]|uniref:Lipoprotein n=1 Tax=Salmonella enterica TaxID=28901 RepID=A0A5U6SUB7_SALER|nr:hypothetical protein [Salmonella enterica]